MAKTSTTKKSTAKKTSKAAKAKTSPRSSAVSAKKNTTKKKPVRPVKKATTAKTTSSKKATTAKKNTPKKQTDGWQTLRSFYVLQLVVSLALGALVALLMRVVERTIAVSYTSTDALLGGDATAPAIRNLLTIDIRWVIGIFLAINAVYALIVISKGWKRYVTQVQSRRSTGRWIMYTLTSVGALYVAGLINGIQDILVLELLAFAVVASAIFSIFAERLMGAKERKYSFYATAISVISIVAVVGIFMANTYIYGFVTQPWYVLLSIGGALLGLVLYLFALAQQLKVKQNMTDPLTSERNYMLITFLMQLLVVAPLIVGFLK